MTKNEQRKEALEVRRKISDEDKLIKSLLIMENTLKLIDEIKTVKVVAVYLSTKEEVCLDNLVKLLIKNDYKVMAPRINNDILDFYYIDKESCDLENGFEINRYGIREPLTSNIKANINDADIILCPGLLFDNDFNRLGHGKGYYDKMIKNVKGIKVGICFDIQIVDQVIADVNDIKMDYLITESNIFKKQIIS